MLLAATAITNSAAQAGHFVSTINWSHPTWDMFIFIFFIAAVFVYGFSLGRDRVVVILTSAYMALAVVNAAPYLQTIQKQLGIDKMFAIQLITFIVLFLVIFILMSRSGLVGSGNTQGAWWQVILFSFLQVGLLISIILSFLPGGSAGNLSPFTRQMFTTDVARFVWIVAPILAMLLVKGKKKRRSALDYDYI